ncbi:hypothetical protein C0J52_22579 [Blattella germanica]|nr:hypothetical protein C0J52_22579 [Blattella germanica]
MTSQQYAGTATTYSWDMRPKDLRLEKPPVPAAPSATDMELNGTAIKERLMANRLPESCIDKGVLVLLTKGIPMSRDTLRRRSVNANETGHRGFRDDCIRWLPLTTKQALQWPPYEVDRPTPYAASAFSSSKPPKDASITSTHCFNKILHQCCVHTMDYARLLLAKPPPEG